jgi:hypothetical protein
MQINYRKEMVNFAMLCLKNVYFRLSAIAFLLSSIVILAKIRKFARSATYVRF